MPNYRVHVETADRGTFKVDVQAATPQEAETIARAGVRNQFSNEIISSWAVPKEA